MIFRLALLVHITAVPRGTDFSSMHCIPQYLEGGFGKQLPDDRPNCLHQEYVSARYTNTAECVVVFFMTSVPVRIPCVLA